MTLREYAALWVLILGAAMTASLARIGLRLSLGEPPDDPVALRRWARRRRWFIVAELSALPMFATIAVLAAAQGWLSPVAAVLCGCLAGALGFPFVIHALEVLVRLRLNLPEVSA